jgi:hypothetical protein
MNLPTSAWPAVVRESLFLAITVQFKIVGLAGMIPYSLSDVVALPDVDDLACRQRVSIEADAIRKIVIVPPKCP